MVTCSHFQFKPKLNNTLMIGKVYDVTEFLDGASTLNRKENILIVVSFQITPVRELDPLFK